ncbi:hypothetical protein ABRG53_1016 [Pseudanabaena sp. ABRG5-3]|nr:hypothetical protein ABRG53_1016 [Pseudanabaena sp. ABRG5-3]
MLKSLGGFGNSLLPFAVLLDGGLELDMDFPNLHNDFVAGSFDGSMLKVQIMNEYEILSPNLKYHIA